MTSRRLIVLLCALASAACAELFGFKDLHVGSDAGQPDATEEAAAPDASPDGFVDTCPHARWPDAPDASAPGTPTDYAMALHHVYFTTPEGDAGVADFGYDLDDKCTFDTASASCTSSTLVTDDSNGRDNASIQLVGTLSNVLPSIGDDQVNQTIAAGQFTVVLRLIGLESLVNQQEKTGLQLGVQGSPGLEDDASAPVWDGTDRWLVGTQDSVSGSSNLPSILNSAYVTNGVLVSSTNASVTLRVLLPAQNTVSGTLVTTLRNPVLTGKLVQKNGGLGIEDGLLVGRWNADDMLKAIGDLTAGGGPVCDYVNGAAYAIVRSKVCPLRDVNSNGADDGTEPCDAVSVAIRFDADPITVASTPAPFPTSATPCPHEAGTCN